MARVKQGSCGDLGVAASTTRRSPLRFTASSRGRRDGAAGRGVRRGTRRSPPSPSSIARHHRGVAVGPLRSAKPRASCRCASTPPRTRPTRPVATSPTSPCVLSSPAVARSLAHALGDPRGFWRRAPTLARRGRAGGGGRDRTSSAADRARPFAHGRFAAITPRASANHPVHDRHACPTGRGSRGVLADRLPARCCSHRREPPRAVRGARLGAAPPPHTSAARSVVGGAGHRAQWRRRRRGDGWCGRSGRARRGVGAGRSPRRRPCLRR